MKEQEELFNSWNQECEKLKRLSAFIQNDFDIMLSDGTTTKEEISQAVVDCRKSYEDIMGNINMYETKMHKMLRRYAE